MKYKVIAREEGMTIGDANIRYQHIERCNNTYLNPDIDLSIENYHFKKPEQSYIKTFYKMAEDGIISTKRLRLNDSKTKIGSEIIVAVAGDYFESKEQAIEFFKVAHEALNSFFDVKTPDGELLVSGSELCMSSVIHLDEGSYGMHYISCAGVARELKKKRTKKDVEAGREAKSLGWYVQASHSGFWDSEKDEKGKIYYSYSRLNDVIADAYRKAGYTDIERGNRGSTAKHLHPNEFKALMRSVQEEAKNSQEKLDVKRIAGKYVMDDDSYKNLLKLQEDLVVQQTVIEKTQQLLDLQQQQLKQEKVRIKKREIEVDASIVRAEIDNAKYNEAIEIVNKQKKKLLNLEEENKKCMEVISFWENLFMTIFKAIEAVLGWIDTFLHKTLSIPEKEMIQINITNAFDDIKNALDSAQLLEVSVNGTIR